MDFVDYVYSLHSNNRVRSLRVGQSVYKITHMGIERCRVEDISWHAKRYPGPLRGWCVYYWPDSGAHKDLQYGLELVHSKAFAVKLVMAGLVYAHSRVLYKKETKVLTSYQNIYGRSRHGAPG